MLLFLMTSGVRTYLGLFWVFLRARQLHIHCWSAGDEEGAEGEHRFLGSEEGREQGDTQALAPATEEQAAATATQREQLEEEGSAAGASLLLPLVEGSRLKLWKVRW